MKVAVLGGRGVVGGYLSQALSVKHTVTSVTRDQVDLMDTVAVDQFFRNNVFDVVINCAINPNSQMTATTQVATDNLTIFANMYACRNQFGRVLQFCSGAEFDRRRSLDIINESELITSYPVDPYGLAKNSAARISLSTDNFYNLRLFGVFFPTEVARRLLPKILSNSPISLEDKYFDYLYLEDLLPLVEYYIDTVNPIHKDINVVYQEKQLLSEFVSQFCRIHNIDSQQITIDTHSTLNYTGDGSRWAELDLPKLGQHTGMKRYIK